MTRPLSLPFAVVLLGLPVVGCGGGEDPPESTPEFDAAYAPVNEDILEVAADSAEVLGESATRSTGQSASQATELANRTAEIATDVSRLEPPEDLADATATLESTLADTADGFEDFAAAAQKDDGQAAAAVIERLAPVGQELNGVQDFLAEVTGAPTGAEEQ